MNLLIKSDNYNIEEGIINIVPIKKSILKYIGFGILKLKKGNSYNLVEKNVETVAVILYGKCSIKLNKISNEYICYRNNIFEEKATAVYIPRNEEFIIKAIEDCEIALCYARSSKNKKPFIVNPRDIKERSIGSDNFKRIARDIISEDNDVDRLYLGETISVDGNWSSFPPHKHDRDAFPIESKLEEIYHFRFYPPQGFCIQRIYTKDLNIDETYLIRNYDSIIIPKGYHPVVGCPGYKLYYLWLLGGRKRQYMLYEDEEHAWIKKKIKT